MHINTISDFIRSTCLIISWFIVIYHDMSWYFLINHDISRCIMIYHDISRYIMIYRCFGWSQWQMSLSRQFLSNKTPHKPRTSSGPSRQALLSSVLFFMMNDTMMHIPCCNVECSWRPKPTSGSLVKTPQPGPARYTQQWHGPAGRFVPSLRPPKVVSFSLFLELRPCPVCSSLASVLMNLFS